MSQVFICYRRDDTSGHAGRLREFLARRLGAEKVFMDLWSLGPGADFIAAIEEKVGSSEALIALIGKHWLDLRGATGNRRLEDSEDAVRLEIATALRRGIRVIPVLVEGAAMPPAGSLPPDLAPLVRLNALNLGNEHWDDDCRRLLQALTPPRIPRSRIGFRPALAALALALAILVPASPRPREILPAKADVPILGILPFENLTGDPAAEWLGGGLATLLTDTLTSSNNVAVVSARRMAALYSAGQDESSLRRIAAAAGIRYLLTGHVESGPTSLKLVIRLQAIGTDREKTWTLYGSPKSLLGKGGEIVAFARQGMGLAPLERVGALAADFYTSNLEAYRDYVAGLQALQEYRYEEAARSFRAALQEEPGFTVARYRLAQTFAITGRTREALQLIRQAEQEVRGLSGREAGYIRAAALYFSRDSGAIEAYRKLVESFPYDIEAHQLRAQVLSESGLYEDALREWNVMRNLEPDLYTTWNFLGDVYLRTGKFDEAVRYLRQSLALDARRPDTRETLGNAYRALGRFDAAAAEYEEALRIDPAFHDATVQLAVLRALQERGGEAEQLLEPVVSDQGASPRSRIDAAFELSYLLMARGRFRAAAEILSSLQPAIEGEVVREALALSVRGLCALEGNDTATARRLIDLAIRRSPTAVTTRYLFARGLLELRTSAWREVSRTAREIRKMALPAEDPDRTEDKAASYLEGLSLLAQGEAHRAIQLMKDSVDRNGYEYRVYRLGLAKAYLAAGQFERALQSAKETLASRQLIEPRLDLELERVRALLVLAEIEAARGRRDEAAARAREFLRAWQGADRGLSDLSRAQEIAGGGTPRQPAGW